MFLVRLLLLACGIAALLPALGNRARAEYMEELKTLNSRVSALRGQGRYSDADALLGLFMRRHGGSLLLVDLWHGSQFPEFSKEIARAAGTDVGPQQARQLVERARQGYGDAHVVHAAALFVLARQLENIGRAEEGDASLRQGVAILDQLGFTERAEFPDFVGVLVALASDCEKRKRDRCAQEAWNALARAWPHDAHTFYARLAAYYLGRGATRLSLDSIRLAADPPQVKSSDPKYGLTLDMSSKPAGAYAAYIHQLHMRIAWAAFEADAKAEPGLADEAFQASQNIATTSAAAALLQLGARVAVKNPELEALVRELQDLREKSYPRVGGLEEGLLDERTRQLVRDRVYTELGLAPKSRQAQLEARLEKEFPEYARLVRPRPLKIAEAQGYLRNDEVLVVFQDVPEIASASPETFVWLVSKQEVRWARVPLGSDGLARAVASLRCGLDQSTWYGEDRCANLLGLESEKVPAAGDLLPFNQFRAHGLYRALFGDIHHLIKGKHILLVPSGALAQLPFHVLITDKPSADASPRALRNAFWLARSNAISVLPGVSSLQALRQNAVLSRARKPLIGFGNPLLDGQSHATSGRDYRKLAASARERQKCGPGSDPAKAARLRNGLNTPGLRGLADVSLVRLQDPLPDTADELCAVARILGIDDKDIYLGGRATERYIKEASDRGWLRDFRILHFATHGALAGELFSGAEPGLILTPPDTASAEDDGYLSASEVAALKLDAAFVILSACNTAASGAEGAEALSGLARAFFYAGARALFVSHWKVNSASTVKLITSAVRAMAENKRLGGAEAARRSILALIGKGAPHEAHPAYWAPFVVVGEGAATLQ